MSNYVKKIHPPDISRFPYGDWLPCVRNHSGAVFFVTFPPHLRCISITNTFYFPIFTPGPYECGRKKGFRAMPFAPCIQARPADLMKMKNTVRQSIILGMVGTAVYFCVGCSAKQDTSKSTVPVEVFLNATAQQEPAASLAPGTKTIIGGDRLDKVFWSERDTISVYWRASGSADALNSGQRFHCYQYSPSVSTFATQMDVMAPGSYDYYAAFPRPAAVSGTQVSYNLPALQDGTYDMRSGQSYSAPYTGNLDYMLAEPLTGRPGLASDNAMTMNFIHQCHVMRIQVPTGRNRWGRPIRKLRVEFPSPVVGRMTMDLTAPTAAPSLSDGSNTVTAELRQSFDESAEDASDGKYVWLFLCPGTVNGTVRFIAYDEDGNRITSISQQINRKLEAGRITPVNLTIPGSLSITHLTFSIAGNNLGETPNTFTVKAPDGALFSDGSNTQNFTVNAGNNYAVSFYNQTNGVNHSELIRTGGLTFTYDSDNAIVSETRQVPFTEEGSVAVGLTVPYLYFEDFANVSGNDSHADDKGDSAYGMDAAGLPGWTGSRWKTAANTSLEVRTYIGSSTIIGRQDNKYGRIDSPPLTGIKPGKTLNLKLFYDAGSTTDASSGTTTCKFATTTQTGAIAGGYGYPGSPPSPLLETYNPAAGGSPTNMTVKDHTNDLSGCTSTTRLTWFIDYTRTGTTVTAKTFYFYLDNIRVSIR